MLKRNITQAQKYHFTGKTKIIITQGQKKHHTGSEETHKLQKAIA